MNWKGWIGRESTEGIDDASSLLYEIALVCESNVKIILMFEFF